MTAGQNQVGLRMAASQPVHHRPELTVRLRRHGAAVDDADIGLVIAVRHVKAGACQPVAKVGHLGEVHLAAERLDRDVHGC